MRDPHIMNFQQLAFGGLWILLILLGGWWYSQKLTHKKDRQIFFTALCLRLMGGLAFGLVYYFHFRMGDTFYYFEAMGKLGSQILDHPLDTLSLLFAKAGDPIFPSHVYFTQSATLLIVKAGLIFSLVSAHSYWAVTAGFSLLSFMGSWLMYRAFTEINPSQKYGIAFFTLGIPSLIFWSGGLLKDSLALCILGFLCFLLVSTWYKNRYNFGTFLGFLLGVFLLLTLKFYLGLLFLLAFAAFWIHSLLPSNSWRWLILGILTAGVGLTMWIFEDLPNQILIYQKWHVAFLNQLRVGSAYSLGTFSSGWLGLLQAFPAAFITTLIGPFPSQWENPFIAIAGIESLFLCGLSLYLLIKAGPRKIIHNFSRRPWLSFLLAFSFMGFFIAGLFGQNFGTLSRYRMPFLPFFLTAMLELGTEIPANNQKVNE